MGLKTILPILKYGTENNGTHPEIWDFKKNVTHLKYEIENNVTHAEIWDLNNGTYPEIWN